MMWQLICEGACNPQIRDLDALRHRLMAAREHETKDVAKLIERVAFHVRLLRHTTHVAGFHEHEAVCGVCRHVRRW